MLKSFEFNLGEVQKQSRPNRPVARALQIQQVKGQTGRFGPKLNRPLCKSRPLDFLALFRQTFRPFFIKGIFTLKIVKNCSILID
jgi:hypothetical protein